MTDPCPTCTNEPGWIVRPVDPPGVTLPGGAIRTERVPCPDCASPQPDTAPEYPPGQCSLCGKPTPDPKQHDVCDGCYGPQPDTAPEGPWTVSGDAHNVVLRDDGAEVICHDAYGTDDAADGDLARRVAAALNGAPATPAERAVIDATEMCICSAHRNHADCVTHCPCVWHTSGGDNP